jgi:hypothetical protein
VLKLKFVGRLKLYSLDIEPSLDYLDFKLKL